MYSWNGIHSYHPLSSAFLAQIWEVNGHSKKLKPDGNQLMIIGDYILPKGNHLMIILSFKNFEIMLSMLFFRNLEDYNGYMIGHVQLYGYMILYVNGGFFSAILDQMVIIWSFEQWLLKPCWLLVIGDYILPTLYILGITIIQERGIPINQPV